MTLRHFITGSASEGKPPGRIMAFLRMSEGEAEAFLMMPTDETCSLCGRAHLIGWEALNRKCSHCYDAYQAKIDEDANGKKSHGHTRVCERLGIPPKYRECTLDKWNGDVEPEILDFMTSPTRLQVIAGKTGYGKTHMATAVLLQLSEQGKSCLWLDALEAVLVFRDMTDETRRQQLTHRMRKVDVLLLDDLGVERETPHAMESVEAILRYRDSHRLGTLVTTNQDDAAMAESNPSLHRRLTEHEPLVF